MAKPIVWTIAGSDSCGGAGIQADLHTIQALGGYGCSVVTLITAQNFKSILAVQPLSSEIVQQQIAALQTDVAAHAIKLGALGTADIIQGITPFLNSFHGWKVFDPVLHSSSGAALCDAAAIYQIIPKMDLITPNIPEAMQLTKVTINDYSDMVIAAKQLLNLGCNNVLLKGGHLKSDYAADYWTNGHEQGWLVSPRYPIVNNHGSGCTLSSAIATLLALDYAMKDALVIAKMYINQGHDLLSKQQSQSIVHGAWPTLAEYRPRWCKALRDGARQA